MAQSDGRLHIGAPRERGRLLVRPDMQAHEWWDAYAMRALAANGVRIRGVQIPSNCARLVAKEVGEDASHRHAIGRRVDDLRMSFGAFFLPRWAVRGVSSSVAFCTTCLCESSASISMHWRLRRVGCCELHRTKLQGACPGCRKRIWLSDLAVGRCVCGTGLIGDAGQRPEHEAETSLQRSLGAGVDWDAVAAGSSTGSTGPRDDLALYVFLLEALTVLGWSHFGTRGKVSVRPVELMRELGLTPVASVAWVGELWSSLRSRVHLNQALTFVARLYHEEQSARTELSALPLWDWMSQLVQAGASPDRAERQGWISEGALKPRLMHLTTAAALAGLDKAHFAALVRRGAAQPCKLLFNGRRQTLFDIEDVAHLSAYQTVAGKYGKTLKLGIALPRMKYVRDSGLATVKVDRYGRRWLDVHEVKTLLSDLSANARPLGLGRGSVVSLASGAIWQPRHVGALKEFFELLRRGRLSFWWAGESEGFDRYFVGADALGELAWRCRVAAGQYAAGQTELALEQGSPTHVWAGRIPTRLSRVREAIERGTPPEQASLIFDA